jgi:hypothetical protein
MTSGGWTLKRYDDPIRSLKSPIYFSMGWSIVQVDPVGQMRTKRMRRKRRK